MAFKRLFSHHSHNGHQRSRNPNSESSEEVHRTSADEHNRNYSNQHHDVTNEQYDTIKPFMNNKGPAYATDEQYRTRRRSSVQMIDKKFIQSLSNPTTTSSVGDDDSNPMANTSEELCEL